MLVPSGCTQQYVHVPTNIHVCIRQCNYVPTNNYYVTTRVLSRKFFFGGGKAISPQVNTITTTVQSQEYTGGKLPPCPPSLDRTLMYQQIRWVWWNDLDISPFRVLGSLLTAHLLIIDPDQRLGPLAPQDYDNELLHMAHDLANRLLPAFDNTTTGLPHPRVC